MTRKKDLGDGRRSAGADLNAAWGARGADSIRRNGRRRGLTRPRLADGCWLARRLGCERLELGSERAVGARPVRGVCWRLRGSTARVRETIATPTTNAPANPPSYPGSPLPLCPVPCPAARDDIRWTVSGQWRISTSCRIRRCSTPHIASCCTGPADKPSTPRSGCHL